MPKAKRLNGIWGGRARRALGAAVITGHDHGELGAVGHPDGGGHRPGGRRRHGASPAPDQEPGAGGQKEEARRGDPGDPVIRPVEQDATQMEGHELTYVTFRTCAGRLKRKFDELKICDPEFILGQER